MRKVSGFAALSILIIIFWNRPAVVLHLGPRNQRFVRPSWTFLGPSRQDFGKHIRFTRFISATGPKTKSIPSRSFFRTSLRIYRGKTRPQANSLRCGSTVRAPPLWA